MALLCSRRKAIALQHPNVSSQQHLCASARPSALCREGFTVFCQIFGSCRPAQLRDHVLCNCKGMCLEDAVKGFAADNDPRCSI